MELFLSLLVSGLAVGSIYAMVALGFVLVFKSTSVINFAHGEFVMLAAFLSITAFTELELPFFVGLLVIAVVMAALGVLIHYVIMRRMVGSAFFSIVLVTVGLAALIRAGVLIYYGALERGRIQSLPAGRMDLGPVTVSYVDLIILGVVTLAVLAFLAFFRFTRLGLHMRAVAENLEAAAAMGINPDQVYAAAWAIGLAMAAMGGVFYTNFGSTIDSVLLPAVGLRAFPAAILGGLDSIGGAIAGGLIIGVAENIGAGYFGAQWRDVIAFGLMFLVLLLRPSGLFGTKELIRV